MQLPRNLACVLPQSPPTPSSTFTSLNQELVSLDCTLIRPHLLGRCVSYLLPFYVSRALAALLILDL